MARKKYIFRTGIQRGRSVVRANNCDDSSDGVVVNESSRKLGSSRKTEIGKKSKSYL